MFGGLDYDGFESFSFNSLDSKKLRQNKPMKDDLGQRIKENYENRTRYFLPRRSYSIIRLDGKAFHSYTKNLNKPFDDGLINDLDNAVIQIMPEIQGAKFAYIQSDEISILLTDFEKPNTSAWFDGNIQKICSVSASLMTAEFNLLRNVRAGLSNNIDKVIIDKMNLAYFDSRVFTIPDPIEIYNYFVWRWKDCSRNSISMVAQSNFSHKELQGKSSAKMQEMLMSQKDINWSKLPENYKNGRFILKENYLVGEVERSRWVVKPGWKITENPNKLMALIPNYQ